MSSLADPKILLCPFDFTAACRVSLRESVRLAQKLGAELHVLHVVVTPPMVVLTPTESLAAPPIDQTEFLATIRTKRTPEIRAELERAGAGPANGTIVFRDGLHADLAILEYAESASVGLVVMAKHARAAISRFLLGSTTERVLRHATCPVLVIPVAEQTKP
jgi:nucleotide-binding universal stress UspA family protein